MRETILMSPELHVTPQTQAETRSWGQKLPPAEEGDEAFKTWHLTLPFPFKSLWNHFENLLSPFILRSGCKQLPLGGRGRVLDFTIDKAPKILEASLRLD